jgi:PD-(D/E)XK endonuclease
MDRKIKGRLAEAKALAHFVESGYEVYLPYCDGSKYDMLIQRDGKVSRVSVKYTSEETPSGKYRVSLVQSYRANFGEMVTKKFDRDNFDILAAYIHQEDRIVALSVDEFEGNTSVNVY